MTRPDAPGARGRGALPLYPEGVPQFERPVINEYNTVGNRMAPPLHLDREVRLNAPAIKWRIGFGDDSALAARGITGTGTPALLNGLVVTESGLVFGAGGTIRSARGTATPAVSCGRRGSPATSPDRR